MCDWKLMEDGKEKYAKYLCSREWSVKKEAVRERAFGKCERCFLHPMDACHHLTYERKYNERIEDLEANCNGCHAFTHGKSSVDPRNCVTAVDMDHKAGYSMILCPRCGDAYVTPRSALVAIPGALRVVVEMACSACGVDFDFTVQCTGDGTDIFASNFRCHNVVVPRDFIKNERT